MLPGQRHQNGTKFPRSAGRHPSGQNAAAGWLARTTFMAAGLQAGFTICAKRVTGGSCTPSVM